MANASTNKCTACGKAATSRCEHVDEDGHLAFVPYCSPLCQKADWPNHKASCNAAKQRKHLYRVGGLLQAVFYNFRETLFELPLSDIQKGDDGAIHLYEGIKKDGVVLVGFPDCGGIDGKDKEAVLSYCASDEALIHLHKMAKKSLDGIYLKIDEVTLQVKDGPQRVVFHHLRKGDTDSKEHTVIEQVAYPHQILRIKLKDGSIHALDVAGAQFGQHSTVAPFNKYVDDIAATVQKANKFGFCAELRERQVQGKLPQFKPTVDEMVLLELATQQISINRQTPTFPLPGDIKSFSVLDIASSIMDDHVEKWEGKNQTILVKVIKEKSPTYETLKADLLAETAKKLKSYFDWGEPGGEFKKMKYGLVKNTLGGGSERYKGNSQKTPAGKAAGSKGEAEKKADAEFEAEIAKLNGTKTGGWDDDFHFMTGDEADKLLADEEKMAEFAAGGGSFITINL